MLILFFIFQAHAAIPNIIVKLGPIYPHQINSTDNYSLTVYENNTLSDNFNIDTYPYLSCVPNNVSNFKVDSLDPEGQNIQQFVMPLIIKNLMDQSLKLKSIQITDYYSYQNIDVTPLILNNKYIQSQGTIQILLYHFCHKQLTNSEYWSLKNVQLSFYNYDPLQFQYQFICDAHYHPKRFDWSNILLITFESVAVLLLARFGRIYTFKVVFKSPSDQIESSSQLQSDEQRIPFQGFELHWVQSVIYIIILLICLLFSLQFQSEAEHYIIIVVYILCWFCIFHFTDELICLYRNTVPILTQKILLFLRLCDIISIIVASSILSLYLYTDQAWFLSNLISICILGSLVKLFKIISLKDALLFFLPIMIVDVGASIYLGLTIRYEWDSVALRYFNTPLSTQIPYFRYIYKKKCGWVSVLNILFPGFFLGYIYRLDYLNKTYVYEIVGFLGLLIGLILWLVTQYLISFPLPTSIFTQTLIIGVCCLGSYARNEFRILWTGDFYDEILENPFRNELDHVSVKVINFLWCFSSRRNNRFIKSKKQHIARGSQDLVSSGFNGKMQLDSGLFRGLAK